MDNLLNKWPDFLEPGYFGDDSASRITMLRAEVDIWRKAFRESQGEVTDLTQRLEQSRQTVNDLAKDNAEASRSIDYWIQKTDNARDETLNARLALEALQLACVALADEIDDAYGAGRRKVSHSGITEYLRQAVEGVIP
jgi:chromosome segregation ATPase